MNDSVEDAVREWRRSMKTHVGIEGSDVDELEDHLRHEIAEVEAGGIRPAEVVAVAASRIGDGANIAEDMRRARPESAWVDRIRWALIGYLTIVGAKWLADAVFATTLAFSGESLSSGWTLSGMLVLLQAAVLGLALFTAWRVCARGRCASLFVDLRRWWSQSFWAYPAAVGIVVALYLWLGGMTWAGYRDIGSRTLGDLTLVLWPVGLALRVGLPAAALVSFIALDRRRERHRDASA